MPRNHRFYIQRYQFWFQLEILTGYIYFNRDSQRSLHPTHCIPGSLTRSIIKENRKIKVIPSSHQIIPTELVFQNLTDMPKDGLQSWLRQNMHIIPEAFNMNNAKAKVSSGCKSGIFQDFLKGSTIEGL